MSLREDVFDEQMLEALGLLFEQFWVLRDEEPAAYRLIRDRELKLKRYLQDKFGLDLILHQHFAKLEKIPVEPQGWMGIQAFQEPMDYAIFCCALAYTEQKGVDEQFLLSDLTETIQELYRSEIPLDWTLYQHRRSLVRALKQVAELRLIKTIDGSLELFQQSEEEEVLYEVTVYSRYFMRSYPDDLFKFKTIEALQEQEWARHQEDYRRKRVYRRLMMTPFMYRKSEDDPDFAYIRNFRNRLREDFEQHTPFRLEVFKNAAMLTLPDAKKRYTLFPDTSGLADAVLHVSAVIREQQGSLSVSEFGELRLPIARFQTIIKEAKELYGHGWAKKYRDLSLEALSNEIIAVWEAWDMASLQGDEPDMLTILPGAARMIAFYPKDYEQEGAEV
ncbi:TIGR02678 family protein [Paenibacillus sp. F411]|uniref:TIGR02678 family protein n=1 Tax=Paenibacillus sp. F411 TaxID=2820239 RepID=UPI001AAED861|nr:TIGR02678 family protein [Paenibacillus sp. F411]MBO2945206.1 TIGR02678 family protein [Paenibacillus sp. F411]